MIREKSWKRAMNTGKCTKTLKMLINVIAIVELLINII